jgi:serine/threonine protein kinase
VDGQRRTGTGKPLQPDDPERVGSYTILGRIGEGGMGAVYLGRAPDGRQVAIKVVRPELAQDAGFVARFQDEVANAQRVASFCTAQVLDHGESAGRAYMVTEFIDGLSLKEYVKENGELSPGMLQGVAIGVAAALVAIHAAGLIHRDLKPANVMLSFSGPRVIDFGIARALDVASGLTMTGQLVGSPGWMAPERILQQEVTTASDIFSWGCLVAFAQTGANPFGTGDFSVMSARLVHGDPQVGPLPAPLDRLVRAALEKDPRKRPTARQLLLAMVGGESSEAAVLSTLTAWESPVPIQPHGETHGDPQGPPGLSGPPQGAPGLSGPPQGNGVPVAYGSDPAAASHPPTELGPPSGYGPPTELSPPSGYGPPTELSPPSGYGPPAEMSPRSGYGPPTEMSPPVGHGRGPAPGGTKPLGPPPTMAASSPAESPTRPGGSRTRPSEGPPYGPAGGGRRRGRLVLVGAAVVVLAAAGVTGWLATRPDDKPAGKATAAKGPAPLPRDALMVRVDRQAGWPRQCYGSVATLVPTTTKVTRILGDENKCDILPRWSPDRKKIAFTRSTGVSNNELWVANADGSGATKVTNMEGRSRVAWSPESTKIAIVAKVNGARQIDVVTIAKPQSPLQITNDAYEKDDPAWCGDRVAFWSNKTGTQQIYTADASTAGGPLTQVTHESHDVNDPSFSPKCDRMAYTDQPGGDARHVWITTSDGKGTPKQLTTDATRDMDPTFSPDGTWIAVARGATAKQSIWAVRADGTGERQISPDGGGIAHPDWS